MKKSEDEQTTQTKIYLNNLREIKGWFSSIEVFDFFLPFPKCIDV